MTGDDLRKLWRGAGGSLHGPRVETGTMPETALLAFLGDLVGETVLANASAAGAMSILGQVRDECVAARLALAGLELFFERPDEDSFTRFERIAEVFRKETGHLRPGKDCWLENPEIRQAAYDRWVEEKLAAARAVLRPGTVGPGTTENGRDDPSP